MCWLSFKWRDMSWAVFKSRSIRELYFERSAMHFISFKWIAMCWQDLESRCHFLLWVELVAFRHKSCTYSATPSNKKWFSSKYRGGSCWPLTSWVCGTLHSGHISNMSAASIRYYRNSYYGRYTNISGVAWNLSSTGQTRALRIRTAAYIQRWQWNNVTVQNNHWTDICIVHAYHSWLRSIMGLSSITSYTKHWTHIWN